MKRSEIIIINNMRLEGRKPAEIAQAIGIPLSTVRSYLRRHPATDNGSVLCRNCGLPVEQTTGKKQKNYCSDKCRMEWWNNHRDTIKRSSHIQKCEYCGKEFTVYGNEKRKYCGRECYHAARRTVPA